MTAYSRSLLMVETLEPGFPQSAGFIIYYFYIYLSSEVQNTLKAKKFSTYGSKCFKLLYFSQPSLFAFVYIPTEENYIQDERSP